MRATRAAGPARSRHRVPAALAVTLLLAIVVPAPVHADHGGLHISEILPSPADGEREFIELWNDGPAIAITGWTVRDGAATPNVFTFGATTLPTGGRIVVWGGGVADARGPAWSKSTVWNNAGDQAILADAQGNVVDSMAYGSSPWPDGRTDPVPPAPAVGRSLALRDGIWSDASPTPGSVAAEQGASVSATVQDVAPTVSFSDVPATVQPGATFTVSFSVADANGATDISSWALLGDGALLHNGTAAGVQTVSLGAPVDRDAWTLRLEARDAAGHAANTTAQVLVRAAGLVVVVPDGSVSFPPFPPGAEEVLAETTFTMRNDGEDAVAPRIDVSDLTGPATIALAGRLDIGYEAETTTWTPYSGPLTQLPSIGPGQIVDVRLRLNDLPTPLPAGAYGTSFTVVE